jgi:hypothetical protein
VAFLPIGLWSFADYLVIGLVDIWSFGRLFGRLADYFVIWPTILSFGRLFGHLADYLVI